jgi:hypothetical protein
MRTRTLVVAAVAASVLVVIATLLLWNPAHRATSALDRSAPSGTTSAAAKQAGSASTRAAGSGSPITTSSSSYFGRPFETIRIAGRYVGAHRATTLRVQVRAPRGWTQFPLPAITAPSGRFQAYVELGRGIYHVRLVDPERHLTSRVVTVLVF